VAWLLINHLCQLDIIEYGTSSRFGWLTAEGESLKAFVASKTADELAEIACNHDDVCYPDACNCGPNGYENGRIDTSSDIDVIECLRNAPERYHARTVLDHMDDAMLEAKQTLIAMEMSRP
jgi:hypothetical protein